ncbi:MAG TPA: hypothetical protein VFV86_00680 [Nitrososphaeraceae archaeon]|nr:hypothetical protein [Nitrososphaeraceae archaeon]
MSIEPLIGRIKSTFRIDPLPVRGYARSYAIVLLSVFAIFRYLYTTTVKPTKIILWQSNNARNIKIDNMIMLALQYLLNEL